MAKKAPRRTAQRILESALELFNRFGEPNVSTTRIAAELDISPGNLYYHYPSKDTLINRLQEDCEAQLQVALSQADAATVPGDIDALIRALMALVWCYRFIYRDLSNLLSKNRAFEARLQVMLRTQEVALRALLRRQGASGQLRLQQKEADMLARNIAVLLSFWLNYEHANAPREALEPEQAPLALERGVAHILQLLAPYVATAHQDSRAGQSYARTPHNAALPL